MFKSEPDGDGLKPTNPLAVPLVDVLRELVSVKRDRDLFRHIATAAINLLHEQHVDLKKLRAQHARLLQEVRAERPRHHRSGVAA